MIQTDAPLWVPSRDASDAAVGHRLPPGGRQRLPDRRRALNLRFRFPADPERPGSHYHLGIGFYGEEGWRPGVGMKWTPGFVAVLVSGLIIGLLIELITSVVFKARVTLAPA